MVLNVYKHVKEVVFNALLLTLVYAQIAYQVMLWDKMVDVLNALDHAVVVVTLEILAYV